MSIIAKVLAPLAFIGLAACDQQGPMEKAGEQADNAIEEAQDSVEEAAHEVEDSIADAAEKIE